MGESGVNRKAQQGRGHFQVFARPAFIDAGKAKHFGGSYKPGSTGSSLICGGDDDWYEVARYTGETIAVDLDFTQCSPDEVRDLHFHDVGGVDLTPCTEDSPGTCTDAQGQGTNSDEHYEFTVDEAGCSPCTYYVRVHGWDGAENSYGLTLTLQ